MKMLFCNIIGFMFFTLDNKKEGKIKYQRR